MKPLMSNTGTGGSKPAAGIFAGSSPGSFNSGQFRVRRASLPGSAVFPGASGFQGKYVTSRNLQPELRSIDQFHLNCCFYFVVFQYFMG
jgi:hypothetical protein